MNEIHRLVKISFDNLENNVSDAIREEQVGVFGPRDNLSSHGNACEFIQNMEPLKLYLGHDEEIYPKFVLKREYLK